MNEGHVSTEHRKEMWTRHVDTGVSGMKATEEVRVVRPAQTVPWGARPVKVSGPFIKDLASSL